MLMAAALKNLIERGEVWLAERQAGLQTGPQLPITQIQKQVASFASFGNFEIDSALPYGGLPVGAVHEWFLKTSSHALNNTSTVQVPHSIINTLAANFFKETIARDLKEHGQKKPGTNKLILWIGKNVWPTPFLLEQILGQEFFENCAFIDPPRGKLTLWAIETALRSSATTAVIAACSNLSFATSRRLSIAAQKGGGLGLLVRNIAELSKPTMASSRWMLEPVLSKTEEPSWQLSLLKYKGGLLKQNQWLIGDQPGELDSSGFANSNK
jgi:hypothetical protein